MLNFYCIMHILFIKRNPVTGYCRVCFDDGQGRRGVALLVEPGVLKSEEYGYISYPI